jgi:protein phosphatase
MGGHQGGEVASSLACKIFSEILDNSKLRFSNEENLIAFLKKSLTLVNHEVYQRSKKDPGLNGMGTTLSLAIESGKKLYYLNIGDSRIYLIRNGEMMQLTKDDSLVAELVLKGEIKKEEAWLHPLKNIITKALGTTGNLEAIVQYIEYQKNDYYLMCTDGLTDMLNDQEILHIFIKHRRPAKICENLIQLANEHGGNDNITTVIISY